MIAAEQFERELEIFRNEAEAAIQFFYSEITIHAVAAQHRKVHAFLNQTPLFWNTCTGALQTATLIALGRIFDQQSAHNIDRVLGLAQKHPQVFNNEALAKRKQGENAQRPDWLDEYLADIYVPSNTDFCRLRAHVSKWRKVYKKNYRDLRHKVFAHKELADDGETAPLWAKTNVRELQRLLTFLSSLHEALWQLFFNGRRPLLPPLRYSVRKIKSSPSTSGRALQERLVHEVERLLLSISIVKVPSEVAARSIGKKRKSAEL